ncbi:MAG: hypothetical protein GX434_12795 [Peptococcaceae bacterium]|nr:hypothetical protein [Peptococcaceae bacterium]
MENLTNLIEQFQQIYNKDQSQKALEEHRQFLNKFPLEKLKTMTVEEYALGKSKTGSFSWWLEYTLTPGSIKGGSAAKHIIYYSKKDAAWKYPKEYNSVEDAWEKLRSDILELIASYDQQPFSGISPNSLLYSANMLKGKILYLYHPDKFLPIYNLEHIHKFLQALDVPKEKWQGKDNVECNQVLKSAVAYIERLKEWDPELTTRFLYHTFKPDYKYYKIAPGQDGVYWEECQTGGYISIGWNEVGDLRQYPDYDEFKNAFLQYNFQKTTAKNTEKANELWLFYNLKPGDKILANKGSSLILGIGTVSDQGYDYRDDLSTQKHVVYVTWEKVFNPPLEIPKQDYWPFKTILEISVKEYLVWTDPVMNRTSKSIITTYSSEEERFFSRLETALEHKGQCILYGPPGTGKTFLARRFVQWKNEKENILGQTEKKPCVYG